LCANPRSHHASTHNLLQLTDLCPLCEAVFLFGGIILLRCAFCAVFTGLELVQSFKLEKGTIDLLLQFFGMMSMKLVKEFLICMAQTRSVIFFHDLSMNFLCVGRIRVSLM